MLPVYVLLLCFVSVAFVSHACRVATGGKENINASAQECNVYTGRNLYCIVSVGSSSDRTRDVNAFSRAACCCAAFGVFFNAVLMLEVLNH